MKTKGGHGKSSHTAAPAKPAAVAAPHPWSHEEREQLLAELETLRDAQVEVEHSQHLYAELFELAPVGYVNLSAKGVILSANLTAGELLGRDPRILAGSHFQTYIAAEDFPRFAEHLARCRKTTVRDVCTELRLRKREGESPQVLEILSRRTETFGSLKVIYRTVLQDVTARRDAEKALRVSEDRFRALVEYSGDGVCVICEKKRIRYVGPNVKDMLGYAPEELLNKEVCSLAHPRDRGSAEATVRLAALKTGAAVSGQMLRICNKAGEWRWIEYSLTNLTRNPAVGGIVCNFRDITTRHTAEKALEKIRLDLLEAVKQAERARNAAETAARTKDQFLAVLSHELRTPLTPVLLAIRVQLKRADLEPSMRDVLEMVNRNISMEAHFVDDILHMTRIARGKLDIALQPVDLHDAVGKAIEITRGDIDAEGLQLTVSLKAKHQRVNGDSARLQQVVWNLLKNAAKFTPEGGNVSVSTHNERERVVVRVSDTGIGIDPEALSRIFEPFSQANESIAREFGGLGLGLAIAQATIAGHDGKLTVASDGLGKGATFTFTLPLLKEAGAALPA